MSRGTRDLHSSKTTANARRKDSLINVGKLRENEKKSEKKQYALPLLGLSSPRGAPARRTLSKSAPAELSITGAWTASDVRD